jgi:hypothetical protein
MIYDFLCSLALVSLELPPIGWTRGGEHEKEMTVCSVDQTALILQRIKFQGTQNSKFVRIGEIRGSFNPRNQPIDKPTSCATIADSEKRTKTKILSRF